MLPDPGANAGQPQALAGPVLAPVQQLLPALGREDVGCPVGHGAERVVAVRDPVRGQRVADPTDDVAILRRVAAQLHVGGQVGRPDAEDARLQVRLAGQHEVTHTNRQADALPQRTVAVAVGLLRLPVQVGQQFDLARVRVGRRLGRNRQPHPHRVVVPGHIRPAAALQRAKLPCRRQNIRPLPVDVLHPHPLQCRGGRASDHGRSAPPCRPVRANRPTRRRREAPAALRRGRIHAAPPDKRGHRAHPPREQTNDGSWTSDVPFPADGAPEPAKKPIQLLSREEEAAFRAVRTLAEKAASPSRRSSK